jgi:hypothetical protein
MFHIVHTICKMCSAITHFENSPITKLGIKSYMILIHSDHHNQLICAKHTCMHTRAHIQTIASSYGLGGMWFEFWQGQGIFCSPKSS